MEAKKRIIVIDSNILIHRAYHALPPLKNKNGELTNAVYGFMLIFFRAIKEFQPNYVVAVFDTKKPTFRHKEFDEYKMNRPPTPEALSAQIPMIQSILKESGISIFEKEGFEADDIIGTVTRLSLNERGNDLEVIILSCDLDTLQLINDSVRVCALKRGFSDMVLYDPEAVENRYQLVPGKLIDYRALKGDPSDNIPGVAGIGEKTAIKLISSFGSLDNLYSEIKASSEKSKKIQPSLLQKLIDNEDQAWLSRKLSIIDQEVPIDFQLEDCGFSNYNREKAAHSLEGIGFRSLISKLP